MNDNNQFREDPFDPTQQRVLKLAPRMVAWNTALMATWAYLVVGEFVVAREFPEVIAVGFVLAAALVVFLASWRRYGEYLPERSAKQRRWMCWRAFVVFDLLILLAMIVGAAAPETLVSTLMLLVCAGLAVYRARVKRRWFGGLAVVPIGRLFAFYTCIAVVTVASLVSSFSA